MENFNSLDSLNTESTYGNGITDSDLAIRFNEWYDQNEQSPDIFQDNRRICERCHQNCECVESHNHALKEQDDMKFAIEHFGLDLAYVKILVEFSIFGVTSGYDFERSIDAYLYYIEHYVEPELYEDYHNLTAVFFVFDYVFCYRYAECSYGCCDDYPCSLEWLCAGCSIDENLITDLLWRLRHPEEDENDFDDNFWGDGGDPPESDDDDYHTDSDEFTPAQSEDEDDRNQLNLWNFLSDQGNFVKVALNGIVDDTKKMTKDISRLTDEASTSLANIEVASVRVMSDLKDLIDKVESPVEQLGPLFDSLLSSSDKSQDVMTDAQHLMSRVELTSDSYFQVSKDIQQLLSDLRGMFSFFGAKADNFLGAFQSLGEMTTPMSIGGVDFDRLSSFLIKSGSVINNNAVILMLLSAYRIYQAITSEGSKLERILILAAQLILQLLFGSIIGSTVALSVTTLIRSCFRGGTSIEEVELNAKMETAFNKTCEDHKLKNKGMWSSLKNLFKELAGFARNTTFIIAGVTALYKLLKMLYEWALDSVPTSWVFKDPAVREFIEIVYFFDCNPGVLAENVNCAQILEDCAPMRRKIGLEMISGNNPFNSSQISLMTKTLASYDQLRSTLDQQTLGAAAYRFDPLCIWVHGPTGQGKSALVSQLALFLREVDGTFVRDDVVWMPSMGSRFCDGYAAQPIVFFDDFQQMNQKDEEDVAKFFSFMTCNETRLNMAELEKKGTYFRSKVVVVAANASHKNYNLHCPEALLRRRHLVIEAKAKPGATWNGVPFNYDHIVFNLNDTLVYKPLVIMENGVQRKTQGLTLDELKLFVQESWIKRRDEQMRNIEHLQNAFKISPRDIEDLESLKRQYKDWFTGETPEKESLFKTCLGFTTEQMDNFKKYLADSSLNFSNLKSRARAAYSTQNGHLNLSWTQTKFSGIGEFVYNLPWKLIIGLLGTVVSAFGVYKFLKRMDTPKTELNSKIKDNTEYLVQLRMINSKSGNKFETCARESGTGRLQVRERTTGKLYSMDEIRQKISLNASFDDTLRLLEHQIYSIHYNGHYVVTAHHIIKDMILLNIHMLEALNQKEVTIKNYAGLEYKVYIHEGLSIRIPNTEFSLVKLYGFNLAPKTFVNLLPKDSDLVDNMWQRVQSITFRDRCKSTMEYPRGAKLQKEFRCDVGGQKMSMEWNWVAEGHLKTGDCGALLVALDPAVNRRVIGFHYGNVIGGKDALFYCLTSERLEKYASILQAQLGEPEMGYAAPVDPMIEKQEDTPVWLNGVVNLQYVGHVPKQFYHIGSKKHDIKRSPCFGEIFPATKDLSVLSRFDSRLETELEYEILEKGVLKYASPIREMDPETYRTALKVVLEEVSNYVPEHGPKPRIWTEDEAINGIFKLGDAGRYESCPGLNMDSSAGFPFKKPPNSTENGKRYLFLEKEHASIAGCPLYEIKDAQLRENVDRSWSEFLKGNVPFSLWKNSLKSEKRPLEKIAEGSTRTFTISPLPETLCFRRLFGSFDSAMKYYSKNRRSVAKVGINANGLDWDSMINYFWSFGAKGFALDYSSWDARVTGQMFHLFATVANKWYNDEPCYQAARIAMCKMACHTYTLCGGVVVQKHQGNNSGSAITTELNCIANLATNVAAVKLLSSVDTKFEPERFLKDFAIAVYGDDVVVVPHERLMSDDLPVKWKQALETYGHVVTDAEKCYKTPVPKAVTDLRFLKRQTNVLQYRDYMLWVSALDPESIEQSCNFISNNNSIDPHELLRVTFGTMTDLAWPHGPEYYKMVTDKIFEWSSNNGCTFISQPFHEKQNQYIDDILAQKGITK